MSSTIEPLRDIFDAGGRGLQHQGLRRANERAVLTVIGFNPGVSNADISRLSGLAPQTVSAILTDIDRAGLITRGEVLRGRRGQPATPIFLNPEGAFSIGVEIGWRHVDVLLLNLHAEVMDRRRKAYDFPDAATIAADVVTMTASIVAALSPERRSRLVDMGVALPTNIAENINLVAGTQEQQALWRKLDLVAELSGATGLEVSLFNDGNAACWAELIAFPRPRPCSFIYFLISRYIAAGIVGEGMLWEGPTSNSANLGSMLVGDSSGRQRPAHFTASIAALIQRLHAAGIQANACAIEDWDWSSFGPVLDQWLADSAEALARVVFNTATVIESDLVVVDGIMPRDIVERLVEQLEAALRQLPITPYQPPQVMVGHVGPSAPSIGAAELTLYRRFFSRTQADIAG
jgi:predicted NBD/HSP70 family sugar kinase